MRKFNVTVEGQSFVIEMGPIQAGQTETTLFIDGEPLRMMIPGFAPKIGEPEWVVVADRPYRLQLDRDVQWLQATPFVYRLELHEEDAAEMHTPQRHIQGPLCAPIPGQITRVLVETGQAVQAGQPLLILEAMKMENEIRAPQAGLVRAIPVKAGSNVRRGDELIEITP